jgi:hypothetical protein
MADSAMLLQRDVPFDWERIDELRLEVAHAVRSVAPGGDLPQALGMVSAEMLENAVKFGTRDATGIRLAVRRDGEALVVEVRNGVEPASGHLQALLERVAWCRRFGDAAAAYMAALQEVYARGAPGGGLGLVRIFYEGGCQLTCDTSEPGAVTVSARRALAAAGDAPA